MNTSIYSHLCQTVGFGFPNKHGKLFPINMGFEAWSPQIYWEIAFLKAVGRMCLDEDESGILILYQAVALYQFRTL